jgi:hypothetical protein
MVYIAGEEMTHYCMKLIMEKWITPNVDTSKWEYYDLSCKSRDDTEDKVQNQQPVQLPVNEYPLRQSRLGRKPLCVCSVRPLSPCLVVGIYQDIKS